jgi:hypothetical protein
MTCNGVSSDSHAIRNRLSGASEICNINQIDKNSTNKTNCQQYNWNIFESGVTDPNKVLLVLGRSSWWGLQFCLTDPTTYIVN